MQTIPTITNKDIKAKNERFILAVQTAKSLEAEIKAFWAELRAQMEQHNITRIDGDWGVIQFVEMPNWTLTSKVPPRYMKEVLDTSRLNALRKLGDTTPAGALYTPFLKFDKRIK